MMSVIKKSVRSVVLDGYGGYNTIRIQHWPLDNFEPTFIYIRIHLCGVNFSDIYTRQGFLQDLKTPRILGDECYGIVENVGKDVTNFQCGDRVMCYIWTGGLFREYAIVPEKNCFLIPDFISNEDAVSLPANYLTAYLSIFTMGNLQPGETVLIHSITGGIGCAATQLAKTVKDVIIIGTASTSKHQDLKNNGITRVLNHDNYMSQVKDESPEGFDLIIDSVGGPNIEISQTLLKPCGRLVIIGNIPIQLKKAIDLILETGVTLFPLGYLKTRIHGGGSCYINGDKVRMLRSKTLNYQTKDFVPRTLIEKNITVSGLHLGMLFDYNPTKICDIMEKLFQMMKDKIIKPKIYTILPFDQVVTAQKLLATRENYGKVLLKINHK